MHIDAFALGGYRSFGEKQVIGPLSKINFFVGRNNCGKSNILRFINDYYASVYNGIGKGTRTQFSLEDFEQHKGQHSKFSFSVGVSQHGELFSRFQNRIESDHGIVNELYDQAADEDDLIWIGAEDTNLTFDEEQLSAGLHQRTVRKVARHALGLIGGRREKKRSRVVSQFFTLPKATFDTMMVPAFRKVGDMGSSIDGLKGDGIIDHLARLQSPTLDNLKNEQDFDSINRFVKKVLGNESAEIRIPHNRNRIQVKMDGKTLPLASLGTGVHEVVILASVATVASDKVICMEEPELHLHPLLQRKLISYLRETTENQYFISTHSTHILDVEDSSVFHITHDGTESVVDAALTPRDRAGICRDLGYRASDLIQSNCVIWVEGPSDRVYLNHWLQAVDANLKEGLHYSIMFYGGRLLSHLTPSDPEVEDFISLRRLNRNLAVVIDSDKTSAQKQVNDTKKRVRDAFFDGPGFAWITEGREIENYVAEDLLFDAIQEVHSSVYSLLDTGKYAHKYEYRVRQNDEPKKIDKVKVAHEVAKKPAELNVLDLQERIEELVGLIRQANGERLT